MATDYYVIGEKDKALKYINKLFNTNPKSNISPVMLYTRALIQEDLGLPYKKYIKSPLK